MAVKTKKPAKTKTKRKPMFRAETAVERQKNGGGCCGGETKGTYTLTFEPPKAGDVACDALQAAPTPKMDLQEAGKGPKRWAMELRPEGQGGAMLCAVEEGTRRHLATLLKFTPDGIHRFHIVGEMLIGAGFELQGLPLDHLGRVKVAN